METTIRYLGGSKFEAAARDHRVICDQPHENGGSNEGMSPPEFLLASLGTCAAYYVTQYLNARHISSKDVKVRVSAQKALHPARLATFLIQIVTPHLDERHQAGALRAAKSCLIHNTLLQAPEIDIKIEPAVTESGVVAGPATIKSGTETWSEKPSANLGVN